MNIFGVSPSSDLELMSGSLSPVTLIIPITITLLIIIPPPPESLPLDSIYAAVFCSRPLSIYFIVCRKISCPFAARPFIQFMYTSCSSFFGPSIGYKVSYSAFKISISEALHAGKPQSLPGKKWLVY